jgi:hypothetical protein
MPVHMAVSQSSPAVAAVNLKKNFLNRATPLQTDLPSE